MWGASAKHSRGQKVGMDHVLEDEDGTCHVVYAPIMRSHMRPSQWCTSLRSDPFLFCTWCVQSSSSSLYNSCILCIHIISIYALCVLINSIVSDTKASVITRRVYYSVYMDRSGAKGSGEVYVST